MADFVNKISNFIASTQLGQFIIKKLDLLLWMLEKPAKYSVDGENKNDKRNLPWPIFWTILVNLQIVRVVCSTILIQFNKNPIESKDVVDSVQKWRRTLRVIRFRGLRAMREKTNANVSASAPVKQHSKKRSFDVMEHDLLDELMNRTFSDDDQTDSTFMISRYGDVSTNGSSMDGPSFAEEYQSPPKSKEPQHSPLQDTLPYSASESERQEPNVSTKSNELTFVSTVEDTEESALTEDDSDYLISGHTMQDISNGTPPIESVVQSNGSTKVGKEALNVPIDPVDVFMSQLVEMESNGKFKVKKSGKNNQFNKKKRNNSLTGQENTNRRSSVKPSRSQESINKL